jgi:hypothetical protein
VAIAGVALVLSLALSAAALVYANKSKEPPAPRTVVRDRHLPAARISRSLATDPDAFGDAFPWSGAPEEPARAEARPEPEPEPGESLADAWIEPLCASDEPVRVVLAPGPTPVPTRRPTATPQPTKVPPTPTPAAQKTPTAKAPVASPTRQGQPQTAKVRTATPAPNPPAALVNEALTVKPFAHINNANITFYDCKVQGFCNEMYNGRKVYEGAAACSFDLELGTRFRILGDPTERIYHCDDRGLLSKTWVDIFFHDPDDGYSWQGKVGRCATVEIVVPR